jgi:SAM-dependent methyltransferase
MNDIDKGFINASDFDFLDFGCSAGGSLERYGKMFQAEGKGLGLDISSEKVRLTKEKGFNAEVCDITKLQLTDKIRFGVMHHFLEHIPSIQDVNLIVKKACSVIDDFLIIRQPYYDADPYLFSQGFKFFWSDWKGHPNHMTLLEFHNILMPMVSEGLIKGFSLYGMYPVTSSEDSTIHNIDSKIDQHDWKAGEHTPKKNIEFTIPVYREVMAIVDLSGNATEQVEEKLKPHVKFFSSDNTLT